VIYHIHGAEFRKFSTEHKTAVMKVLKKCDAVIALSESWKKYFEECLNAPNVHVINNVIPLPKVMPTYSQEKCVKFLFLGYLGVRKGIYDLLEAISSHILNLENRALFYVGGNGETAEVQQYIAEKGLCNVVKFCGWVSGDEKVKLLNESDVYVLPSYNEGLPISILEAMSYGMPIITSNVGGIPEIVNEDNGIIVEPGNKQQIYEAICSMLNNPSLVQIKGNFSLSKVKTYLPEMVCSQLTKLYKSLI
jgi:glycosyltransferase involved in cell wall biosynthesis